MKKHTIQKRILVLLLVSLCFVTTHILVFSTPKVHGAELRIVHSIDAPGKLNKVPGKYSVPMGLAWDGEYLWNADFAQDRIYKLNPSNGEIVKFFSSPGRQPMGLAWDGQYLWNAVLNSDAPLESTIYKLNPSTGAVVFSFNHPGNLPGGLAWDGQYLWNVGFNSTSIEHMIYKLNPSTGEIIDSFGYPVDNGNPMGLTWDGQYLWCADSNGTIYKLDVQQVQPSCLGTLAISIIMPVTLIVISVLRRRE